MDKNFAKNLLIILLLSITAFSMIRYISELKSKYRLQDSLNQAQNEIAGLSQEKQNLLKEIEKEQVLKEELIQKNSNLKDYLRASKNRMTRLFQDNDQVRKDLDETQANFSILKAENRALIDSRKRIYLENEQFKAKLSSITELKKAIRELKTKKRQALVLTAEGNRGFVIKDGQPTISDRLKIEVVPASH